MNLPVAIPSPLTLLFELGQAFHSTLELDPLLLSILKHMQSAARSEGASIWLLDQQPGELVCTHAVGPDAAQHIGQLLPAPGTLLSPDGSRDDTVRLDDGLNDPIAERYLTPAVRARTRNAVIAPLAARGQLLGTLVVSNRVGRAQFTEDEQVLVATLAGHAAVAIHNAQLYEQQRRHVEIQKLLQQIGHHLQQTLDSEVLVPLILEEVNTAIGAEAQSLWLLNPETGCIDCRYATGPGAEAIKKVAVPMGQGVVGRSVDRQEAIIITDAQNDDRVFHAADAQTGFVTRSLICVPLVRQGRAIGALEAVNKRNGPLFSKADLELLRSIADSAALAIENARLYAELSASYDSTLDALAAALDLRDRETEGHSRRVVEYTARLARQLALDEATVGTICRGALIHDIGKIGVPDAILHKPGLLTPAERQTIQKHAQAGYEMLLGIPYLKAEVQIVLAHQEHWDGRGYPLGLCGEEIPLGARLFAIADTYDALTSDRPYRRSVPYAAARQIIAAESGRQFDPGAVAAFLAVPQAEWEAIREQVLQEIRDRRSRHDDRVRLSRTRALNGVA